MERVSSSRSQVEWLAALWLTAGIPRPSSHWSV